jgi:hypothetical protein
MGNDYRSADYAHVTGEDGRFSIGVPTGGPYQVKATAPGFLPEWARCDSGQSVEIALTPAAEVDGRVVDSGGRGVANILVAVTALSPEAARPKFHRITDAAGGFRFEGPAGAEYRIEIDPPGRSPVSVTVTAPATPVLRTSR